MNDNWVTLLRLDTAHQAHMAVAHLELADIKVRLLDELSTQVAPIYSAATGGVRVQVQKEDVDRAKDVLKTVGYEFNPAKPNWIVTVLSRVSSKIPIVKNWRIELQWMFMILVIASAILIPIGLSNAKEELTDIDRIGEDSWCIMSVKENGVEVQPEPTDFTIIMDGCEYSIYLRQDERLTLPPFGSQGEPAVCVISDDYILLEPIHTNGPEIGENLFAGEFRYELDGNHLVLWRGDLSIDLSRY